MSLINRTIWGSALSSALFTGTPLTILPHTTLNEKFNVLPNVGIGSDMPAVRYLCIGNKGHISTVGVNNIPYNVSIPHRAKDAALYGHLPFVLRELDNDLTSSERSKYRMRVMETHNGIGYIAYYMKIMDVTTNPMEFVMTTVTNNVSTVAPFVPNASSLNPTTPTMNGQGVVIASNTLLSDSIDVAITFNAADTAELINVAIIMYNNASLAIISEIGICSGVDVPNTTGKSNAGATISYTEVSVAQIVTFISMYDQVNFTGENFTVNLKLGGTEPMLAI